MDNGNEDKPWNWQGDDYYIKKDPDLNCSLNGMSQETTPVKACRDLAYNASFSVSENMNKEVETCRETSSQLKRRRMLQFNNQAISPMTSTLITQSIDPSTAREELSSEFLESNNRNDPDVSQWDSGCSGFSDDLSVSCFERLDQSPDEWISECFNDSTMQFHLDDLNFLKAPDFHFDLPDVCDEGYEANNIPQSVTQPCRKIIFKGKKSCTRPPTKLASSIAYPFAIIKPCGDFGDVTLKDINKRIRTPPPSNSKKEDQASYPTSAFSGKPVVVKTKIHTMGRKGSITILRTKG